MDSAYFRKHPPLLQKVIHLLPPICINIPIYNKANKEIFRTVIILKALIKAKPTKPKLIKNPYFKALL